MSDEPGVARDAVVEQAIILVFSVAGLIIYVWIQRHASDPDAFRRARMRSAKSSERAYARAAGWCWRRAEDARLAYERDRT